MSHGRFVIGVDVGTQGTKSALYRDDGTLVAECFEASRLLRPGPGMVEQNPSDLFGSVLRTIRTLMNHPEAVPGRVEAVGIDGQMAGILGIDAGWQAVTPLDSWLDTRCEPYIRRMKEDAEWEIIRSTGGQVTYSHGPKILWWKEEQPDCYRRIAKFLVPSAYLAGKLCGLTGEAAFVDETHLHFSGFADNPNLCWNSDLLKRFAVNPDNMPRICRPEEVIGGITAEWAEECGLLAGTPVVAGCGDSAASSLGAGIVRPGYVYDVAGTASVFSCSTDAFVPDTDKRTLLYARSVIRNLWIPLAYVSGGGLCLHWFRENHGGSYEEWDREAGALDPGSGGLFFVPHFAGGTCPSRPGLRGAYLGLRWDHREAHLYRAVLESIAYEYWFYHNILQSPERQVRARVIYGTGGGSRSDVFNQIKADVLELPYIPLRQGETAAFGSAMLAAHGVGLCPDLAAMLERCRRTGKRQEPQPGLAAAYQRYAERYVRILEDMNKLYKDAEIV